jgi:hypothetical protein
MHEAVDRSIVGAMSTASYLGNPTSIPGHVMSDKIEVTVGEDFLQVHVFSLLVLCHQWSSVVISSIIVVI